MTPAFSISGLLEDLTDSLPFSEKAVGSAQEECPLAAIKKLAQTYGPTVKKYAKYVADGYDAYKKLRYLRIGKTKDGYLALNGAKKALDFAGGGKFTPVSLFKKVATEGLEKAAGKGAAFAVLGEGVSQFVSGKFDPGRLAAVGITGAVGAAVGQVAFAGAVALVAATSAPAWVPVVAGVAASVAVGYAIDEAEDKFHLTDHLAEGINSAGQKIASLFD